MIRTEVWLRRFSYPAFLLFAAFLYLRLGRDYLFEWDEAIYANLGREMLGSRDLLTPTWNQELWLEKPPVIAWVTALGMTIFGVGELGARFFMPLFAALTLFFVYKIGTLLKNPAAGTIAASILGTFSLFLSRARVLNTDILLLAGMSGTVWLILSGASPVIAGAVAGLAVMSKGLAGLITLLIAAPLLYRQKFTYLKLFALGFLLTVLPWHLYQWVVNGSQFLNPYFYEQVLRRATVPIEFHLESRWFYFLTLYKDLGLGVIAISLYGLSRVRRDTLVLAAWVLIPLVIFTLAKTRLSWYILPVYPGLALLIGLGLTSLFETAKTARFLSVLGLLMSLQMLLSVYLYTAPGSTASPLPDHIVVAKALSAKEGSEIAYLVSESERTAQAILPAEQTISSSFRYGGAPSVVYYSGKKVRYFYNYDDFRRELVNDSELTLAVTTPADRDKLPPGFEPAVTTPGYIGYTRGEDADR